MVVLYWPKLEEPITLIFWSLDMTRVPSSVDCKSMRFLSIFLSLTGENQSECSEKLDVLRAEV